MCFFHYSAWAYQEKAITTLKIHCVPSKAVWRSGLIQKNKVRHMYYSIIEHRSYITVTMHPRGFLQTIILDSLITIELFKSCCLQKFRRNKHWWGTVRVKSLLTPDLVWHNISQMKRLTKLGLWTFLFIMI